MDKNEYFKTFYIPTNMGVAGKLFGFLKISTALQVLGAWFLLFFVIKRINLTFSIRVAMFFILALILAFAIVFLNNKRSLPKTIKEYVNFKLGNKILTATGYQKERPSSAPTVFTKTESMTAYAFQQKLNERQKELKEQREGESRGNGKRH